MSSKKSYDLFKTLTNDDLKEICKSKKLRRYSGLRHDQLAKFVAENSCLSFEEVEVIVNDLRDDKLISKVRDADDHFQMKKVTIDHYDNQLIKAKVGRYEVSIYNLGTDDFYYRCGEGCQDFSYQVKNNKYPFCKHYPAVIAELIYQKDIDPNQKINNISGRVLDTLKDMVEKRRREDGFEIGPRGRDIDNTLKELDDNLIKISKQDDKLARQKYFESSVKVFETLVNNAFMLLDYETIPRRKEGGWDLLVVGTYAPVPYLAVVECKTANSGVYDHLVHDPDYLSRLKSYVTDMCKNKLNGVYRDYVKYMVLVAPDFPEEIVKFQSTFKQMTGGIKLSFLPASTLLYWVKSYRENPILTHFNSECMFNKGIIKNEDVDSLFLKSEEHIKHLIKKSKEAMKVKMDYIVLRNSDFSYINIDEVMLKEMIEEIILSLHPYLLKKGIDTTTGAGNISIKHDYYKIWEKVLKALIEEFTAILEEQSFVQVKRSNLKENLIQYLGLND